MSGVHFHAAGRLAGVTHAYQTRAARPGRVLWAHLVPTHVTTVVKDRGGKPYRELIQRGALQIEPGTRPALRLDHQIDGGQRVGTVVLLVHYPTWTDAAMLVDESPAGDMLLAGLDTVELTRGRVPVSVGIEAIPEHTLTMLDEWNRPYVRRAKAWLREVAIVPKPAYEGAYIYARSDIARLPELNAAR